MGYGEKRVLVIAAHPDDEAIGCGGTIFRLKADGWQLGLVYMSDGIGSRGPSASQQKMRKKGFDSALDILSPDYLRVCDFPDNQFDTVPQLEINRALQGAIDEFRPALVITHWDCDLNVDHRITSQAALVASRPLPSSPVHEFWMFEVRSSSDYAFSRQPFRPQVYMDIGEFCEEKIQLLKCYESEMRESPHSRSICAIEAGQVFRGNTVGIECAEAFELRYSIW